MSISFRPEKKISSDELFDGRLERMGIHEHLVREDTSQAVGGEYT